MKYVLDCGSLSGPALAGLERTIKLAKQSHMANVQLRLNGEWVQFEADWIKYLKLAPSASTETGAPGEATR